MLKSELKYLLLIILCLFSSGCAISLSSTKPVVSPSVNENNCNIQSNTANTTESFSYQKLDGLTCFISSYNKRLDYDTASNIADIILTISDKYQVDYKIVTALIAIESSFNTTIRSPSGAIGLGQLKPETANMLNVKNPLDPQDNLEGTVKLLRSHLEKYQGDINYALAAYKMGCGAVMRRGISQPQTADYIRNIRKVFNNVP